MCFIIIISFRKLWPLISQTSNMFVLAMFDLRLIFVVLLFGHLDMTRKFLWKRVCPFTCSAALFDVHRIGSFFFLKLATMLGAHTLFSYMWNTLPHKFGSAIRIVLQFCIVKEAKRDMEIILLVLWKKSYSEQFGHFLTKMVWRPLNSESALRIFY